MTICNNIWTHYNYITLENMLSFWIICGTICDNNCCVETCKKLIM